MRDINYDEKMEVIGPPKDHAGVLVRYVVIGVLGAAAAAGLAYTMGQPTRPSALNGQQVSENAPAPMEIAANEAAPANPAIPARAALDPSTQSVAPPVIERRAASGHRVPPAQAVPAEPAFTPAPPMLPPAAEPAQALPEVTPQSAPSTTPAG